jgi:hypothetical protein
MPIFHISTPVAELTREQVLVLREFMRERRAGENTIRHNADGPYLYSILSDKTQTLDQVRDWLINQSLATFGRRLGFAIKEADPEFGLPKS